MRTHLKEFFVFLTQLNARNFPKYFVTRNLNFNDALDIKYGLKQVMIPFPSRRQPRLCVPCFRSFRAKVVRTQSRSCREPKRQLPIGVSFRELGREAHLFPLPLKRSLRQGGAPRDREEEVGQPSNQKQFGEPHSGSGTYACRWQWLAPRGNTARNGTPKKTGAHSHDFSLYKGPVPKLHMEPAELYGRMIRNPFFECSWLEKTPTLLCYPREEKGAAQNKTSWFFLPDRWLKVYSRLSNLENGKE